MLVAHVILVSALSKPFLFFFLGTRLDLGVQWDRGTGDVSPTTASLVNVHG